MSNAAVDVEIRIKSVDKGASSGIAKYAKEVEKSTKQAENAVTQSNTRQRSSYEKLSHARETLGFRSEQTIQREIKLTEAAYKRLETSGTLSQAALARAADKTKSKITSLTNEMGKLTAAQIKANKAAQDYEKTQGRLRLGASAAVGLGAAGYALKGPLATAMSFDERLAGMATTAFPERNAKGTLAGAKALEAVINRSVDLKRGGGGTRDQAASALEVLIGEGNLGLQGALDSLPTVTHTAFANRADPLDIAKLSSTLYGQGIVKNDHELKTALNMVTASGQAGGFEIKDLAKALPEQLGIAKGVGMTGLTGLQKVLTMNQAAVLTSGGVNEAGVNVKNLLSKLNSPDTANQFKAAGRGDLAQFMLNERAKGVDAVDAWLKIIDKEAEKSPMLKEAMKKLKAAQTKEEKTALVEALSQMTEGSVIGQFFHDMQAKSALLALRNTDTTSRVDQFIGNNRKEFGTNDKNFDVMSSTTSAVVRNAEQEAAIAQKSAMDKLTPTISKAADLFTDLAQKFPSMTSATLATVPPLVALAGAAGMSALALGGGKAGAAGTAVKNAGALTKLGARASLYAGGAIAGDYALDAVTEKDSAINRYGKAALNGAAYGAIAGNIIPIPGVGAGIGALAGGGIGLLYEAVGDMLKNDAAKEPQKVDAHLTVDVAPGFVVKRADSGNNMSMTTNGNTGNFFSGAPG